MNDSNPWDVNDYDFPTNGSVSERLKFLINFAVLAPSGHNTQPWLFAIDNDTLSIFADRSRALAVIDPDDREMVMSCGAALFHLRVASKRFGYSGAYELLPEDNDPDLLATFTLGNALEPSLTDFKMFEAIAHRRTNRKPFQKRDVPEADLRSLQNCVEEEGARLDIFTDSRKSDLALIVADGDRVQGSNKHFRRELAAWVRPGRSQSRDGIPSYSSGVSDLRTFAGPFLLRTFDWGEGRAARDLELAEGSPALVVISTSEDDQIDWMRAGMALDHLLLQAHDYRLSASFLNQPIEVDDLRPRVQGMLDRQGFPQTILRIGYGIETPRTPRRPVSDVLLD